MGLNASFNLEYQNKTVRLRGEGDRLRGEFTCISFLSTLIGNTRDIVLNHY